VLTSFTETLTSGGMHEKSLVLVSGVAAHSLVTCPRAGGHSYYFVAPNQVEGRSKMTYRHLPLFVMLVVLSMSASADIVFNSFGPGDSYDPVTAYAVSGATPPGLFENASAFTPSGNFTLTQIDVGIANDAGTNSVMLSLDSDSGGLPDGLIESWNLTGLPSFGSTSNTVQTVTPVSPVSLISGTQYWLVASPIASDTVDSWNRNSIGAFTPRALNTGSGFGSEGTELAPAFDVLGTPVPEPSYIVLLATVLGVVGVALRRRVHHLGGDAEGS
jgi:hypothetical protein